MERGFADAGKALKERFLLLFRLVFDGMHFGGGRSAFRFVVVSVFVVVVEVLVLVIMVVVVIAMGVIVRLLAVIVRVLRFEVRFSFAPYGEYECLQAVQSVIENWQKG